MKRPLITRWMALQRGLRLYETRDVCWLGHKPLRRTKNSLCDECQRLRGRRLMAIRKVKAWRLECAPVSSSPVSSAVSMSAPRLSPS
jgi:hypothetical protein